MRLNGISTDHQLAFPECNRTHAQCAVVGRRSWRVSWRFPCQDKLPSCHRGHAPSSLTHQLHPATHAELRQQRRDVELYGALGKVQRSGDLFVG